MRSHSNTPPITVAHPWVMWRISRPSYRQNYHSIISQTALAVLKLEPTSRLRLRCSNMKARQFQICLLPGHSQMTQQYRSLSTKACKMSSKMGLHYHCHRLRQRLTRCFFGPCLCHQRHRTKQKMKRRYESRDRFLLLLCLICLTLLLWKYDMICSTEGLLCVLRKVKRGKKKRTASREQTSEVRPVPIGEAIKQSLERRKLIISGKQDKMDQQHDRESMAGPMTVVTAVEITAPPPLPPLENPKDSESSAQEVRKPMLVFLSL